MIEFLVVRTGSPREISPVELTPGFPRLASALEHKIIVVVEPAYVLPNGEDIEREKLRDHGVHTQQRGLAVLHFQCNDDADSATHCREAVDLWCQFAHLLGWSIWGVRLGDGLPPFEVRQGVSLAPFFGHGSNPSLVVVPPRESLGGLVPSRQVRVVEATAASEDKDAA